MCLDVLYCVVIVLLMGCFWVIIDCVVVDLYWFFGFGVAWFGIMCLSAVLCFGCLFVVVFCVMVVFLPLWVFEGCRALLCLLSVPFLWVFVVGLGLL